jgi:hypothetical protein
LPTVWGVLVLLIIDHPSIPAISEAVSIPSLVMSSSGLRCLV